jgi:energy-coupling factor transport system substrate-specific component
MIGARFSLYPMGDDFVPIILKAVQALNAYPLEQETDDISTFLSGEENALFAALEAAFARAIQSDRHVVMNLTLSRGCPGEPGEDVCDPAPTVSQLAGGPSAADATHPHIACQFSLYPMGTHSYMETIYAQIKRAQQNRAVSTVPQHFCTRLEGPLPAVMAQLREAFDHAAETTPHVVIHATLSANSPTGA